MVLSHLFLTHGPHKAHITLNGQLYSLTFSALCAPERLTSLSSTAVVPLPFAFANESDLEVTGPTAPSLLHQHRLSVSLY